MVEGDLSDLLLTFDENLKYMDSEKKNFDIYVKRTICHEWGHVLANYLLYGTLKNIDRIDFEDTLFGVYGHTMSSYMFSEVDENDNIPFLFFIEETDDKQIMIFLAGVVAEKICGYNKGRLRPDATDKTRIEEITSNKKLVSNLRKKTDELLSPLKNTLNALTERTLMNYPRTRDEDHNIFYRVFQHEIIEWINELFPESLKPQKVCCVKRANPLNNDNI